ncbi:MAG: hydrolase [Arachnia propionica]|nr:MAG: hydrolase [Arachnia propionica]
MTNQKSANWITVAQWLLGILAVVLVVALVAVIAMGGRTMLPTDDQTVTPTGAPTSTEQPNPGPPTKTGPVDPNADGLPGVPSKAISEHVMWPNEENQNADRQLGYDGNGSASVQLGDGLSQDLQGYWNQEIKWRDCGNDRCGTVQVPLDWEKPGDGSLEIAFRWVGDLNAPKGPVFVNPGGPGYGGQSFAERVAGLWEGYAYVGWDPRGTGDSTAVKCGDTQQTDAVFSTDSSPDDETEKKQLLETWQGFAKQCRDESGALLDHLTTIENVRDLDLLRYLLGSEKLNYFGVSYGTYVGAMYAELFPERVGRMVLDSAVDITDDEDVAQAEGFELALRNYAEWCAKALTCDFGDTPEKVLEKISAFVKGLDQAPIVVNQSRNLTQGLAITGIALYLYFDEGYYPDLTQTLQQAMEGDGEMLLAASDDLNGRTRPNGYETAAYAFPATLCADWADSGVADAYKRWQELQAKSPIFATNMGVDLVCQAWTANSAPPIKITADGAAPILVVGSTGDSATPYKHAQTMAEQLDSGVLLTYDGAGHGSVTNGNPCVTKIVTAYMVDGEVPESGQTCK